MRPSRTREPLAVEVGIDARNVWASLRGRDFAAVQDLVATLIEFDRDGQPLDPLAHGSTGYYTFDIIATRHILGAVAELPDGLMLFALGRPTTPNP